MLNGSYRTSGREPEVYESLCPFPVRSEANRESKDVSKLGMVTSIVGEARLYLEIKSLHAWAWRGLQRAASLLLLFHSHL